MTNLLISVITALIIVESDGKDSAKGDYVNDIPMAIGCLQIWPGVVEDVNRISNKVYTLEDRLDRKKSIEMAIIYLSHYCSEKRLGRKATAEDYARCWNGGPTYFRKPDTVKAKLDQYWEKVQRHLK